MPTNKKIIEARKMLCAYISQVAKEKGITHQQMADATGFERNNVGRMLAGHYAPSLDNFMKLCESVDVYFFIIDKEADDDLVKTMKDRWKRKADKN